MTFTYERDRSIELLKDLGLTTSAKLSRTESGLATRDYTKLCLRLYHSMFIVHDEWQDLITQTFHSQ